MNITELLTKQAEDTYGATLAMLDLVDEDALDWKPDTGHNWMTMSQLLNHLEHACGLMAECFVSGDWSVLQQLEVDESKRDPETGLLPASTMTHAANVADVRAAIAADRDRFMRVLVEAGEERLANEKGAAPWNPTPRALGYNLLECVQHLSTHKSQLFYYLKLQGTPVHTGTLWGM